jgi:hypothetical protein
LSNPFLRPILIDGIGLIKAYRQGFQFLFFYQILNILKDLVMMNRMAPPGMFLKQKGSILKYFLLKIHSIYRFPIVPIIRCIFYWISRGHLTQVFFPTNFSPMTRPGIYGASDQDLANLRTLQRSKIAKFIDEPNFRGL